jgi:hypothetical protein
MMAADWCEVMQLPVTGCWHCAKMTMASNVFLNGYPASWPELWELAGTGMGEEAGPLIEAGYAGRCRGCASRWEPGDYICFSEDEDGWVCADCAA